MKPSKETDRTWLTHIAESIDNIRRIERAETNTQDPDA